MDPVDAAVRAAAARAGGPGPYTRVSFVPFDPSRRTAEAQVVDAAGRAIRVIKGALASIAQLTTPDATLAAAAAAYAAQGYRVLAVAAGPADALQCAGVLALSDPPRPDARELIAQLRALGVQTVMVTGDAPATATVVARQVGLEGAVCPVGKPPAGVQPGDFAVFAGVFPEDKFDIVRAYQAAGHTVGMCGDGANDAPALRQAQMGIAVSTATDVAKSAAGMVLTEPGLGGIVAAVKEGRATFQRILTYTLRSIVHKVVQVLFLATGLIITGHAILTPMLIVLLLITGDLLGMSLTTDNVRPSPTPNAWRIGALTIAGVFMGISELVFCTAVLAIGKFHLGLKIDALRTLVFVVIVFGNQATTYT